MGGTPGSRRVQQCAGRRSLLAALSLLSCLGCSVESSSRRVGGPPGLRNVQWCLGCRWLLADLSLLSALQELEEARSQQGAGPFTGAGGDQELDEDSPSLLKLDYFLAPFYCQDSSGLFSSRVARRRNP